MKVAILGVAGFVGARAVEYLTLSRKAEVLGVVRRYGGLARLSRFSHIEWRMADATNEGQLAAAFEGCDFVLHAIMGDNEVMARCARPAYRAAERVGVRGIVFISSAAVYDGVSAHVVDENTAIPSRGCSEYALAKRRAERDFLKLGARGRAKVAILRPSIITGPRSWWVREPARQLLAGEAWLAEGGPGFCNTVYVDNLLDAALLAFESEKANGEIFLVADDDCVTWGEYYRKLAGLMGIPDSAIHSAPAARQERLSVRNRLCSWRSRPLVKAAALVAPNSVKVLAKRALNIKTTSLFEFPTENAGSLPRGMEALHLTPWRLSVQKARRILNYRPQVSVDEGLRRSAEWLQYAGIASR